MPAQYILAVLAVAFLAAGTYRLVTSRNPAQARTWLTVGAIYALVSLWLYTRP